MSSRAAYGSSTVSSLETLKSRETRAEQLVYRWSFMAVYLAALGSVLWIWITSGAGAVAALGGLALSSLLVFGHFVIFAPDAELSPFALATMAWLIDVLIAFALASGLRTFERAPVLGSWLRRARGRAVEVLEEYPRLKRVAFFGVAVFVLLPVASTGAVTGSFVARILGLSRLAGVVAIALGSAGTCVIFALLATFLGARGEELLRSPLAATSAMLVAGALLWIAFRKVQALLRKE